MDQKAINVIRNLALDIMQNSGAGHPGITMSSAPILYTLFTKNLNINPAVTDWINRDRFVMSAGHGSELLYATMFLCGYSLMLDDLKQYRKYDSKTPGHPTLGITPGVDLTTGLSGEGLATAVGMALAEKIYESKYNYKSKGLFDKVKLGKLFDYYTYVLVGDGDLMEGVSYEAASFAGTYGLSKLIVLYDANNVSVDGSLSKTFTEDVLSRFSSLGWDTHLVKNGNSVGEIDRAIKKAKQTTKPSIIKINTVLGDGLKNQGDSILHNKPLSKEVLNEYKEKIGAGQIPFTVLKEPASYIREQVVNKGIKTYDYWRNLYEEYKKILEPVQLKEIENININSFSYDMSKLDLNIDYENKELLRDSNHRVMNIIASNLYSFIGGSADLTRSTRVYLDNMGDLSATNLSGRNISFGVREHLMGAVLNGLAISGFRPFGSTYMAFSDYLKPSIRMSALMNLPVTYILTHDSITIGSEGPTHQPVEQLATLRAIPNLYVFRPADIKEVLGVWNVIVNNKIPSVISLPKTEIKAEQGTSVGEVIKGAYIAGREQAIVNAVIIATGAEVQVAKSIQVKLLHEGIDVRIISMPCMELFNVQSPSYKSELFPEGVPIFVIEFASSYGWEKFVPSSDYLFTLDRFGVSASKDDVLKYCGLDSETIIEKIKSLLK
ncbi:MAG: transketolase [Bacilli bacterium]|nr:transketolase [Bacilli bacterium]